MMYDGIWYMLLSWGLAGDIKLVDSHSLGPASPITDLTGDIPCLIGDIPCLIGVSPWGSSSSLSLSQVSSCRFSSNPRLKHTTPTISNMTDQICDTDWVKQIIPPISNFPKTGPVGQVWPQKVLYMGNNQFETAPMKTFHHSVLQSVWCTTHCQCVEVYSV